MRDTAPATDLSGGWAKSETNPGGFLGSYVRPGGALAYLYTRGRRGRFYDDTGQQVGPELWPTPTLTGGPACRC